LRALIAVSTVAFTLKIGDFSDVVLTYRLHYSVATEEVLETYRWRWQAGIHFKRLKSILDFGDLPKKNPVASEAWLNGKISEMS
jgi:IS4 transposase